MSKPTSLYRHYNKDDQLLYIGVSLSAYARLSQHKANSEWAKSSVKMTTETFDNREDALKAEKNAIINECPLFNVTHKIQEVDVEIANKEILAAYIECGGTQVTKFLAYIISNHNEKNEVLGTQEAIAKRSSVSISTVKKTMCVLQSKKMIKKVHAGCYVLNPMMLRNAGGSQGVAALKAWTDLQ